MAYAHRNDIDGLRALAIIPVLLFHSGSNFFSGGYIGVDIFFVISGFLITSIIYKEIETDTFSVLNFYERRARRIFPALTIVFIFTLIVGYFVLLGQEYKDFGQSLVASTMFISNILFYLESGYFDAESLSKPLLHTWSLSVEEQYYVFFPLLLLFLHRHIKHTLTVSIFALWILSFAYNIYITNNDQSAAFFLAPSRIWELLTGAILALNTRACDNKAVNEILSLAGLILILGSIFLFDSNTLFPGIYALAPVIGTALIIFSGTRNPTTVSSILSHKVLVFIGLISYSLYLWHWPIFVFAHLYIDAPFNTSITSVLLFITFLAAWISWKFVENPFRGKRSNISRKMVFALSISFASLFLATGGMLHTTQGYSDRLPTSVTKITQTLKDKNDLPDGCLKKGGRNNIDSFSPCILQPQSINGDSYLVWGDSHAASFMPALKKFGDKNKDASAIFTGMQGCPPLIGITPSYGHNQIYSRCADYNQKVLSYIQSDESIKVVILSAYWSLYTSGERLPSDPNHGDLFLTITQSDIFNDDISNNADLLKKGLSATISALQDLDLEVIVIGPFPELDFNGASTLARNILLQRDLDISPLVSRVEKRVNGFVDILTDISKEYPITTSYPHLALCNRLSCTVIDKGLPVFRDRHHLSVFGAEYLYDKSGMDQVIAESLNKI